MLLQFCKEQKSRSIAERISRCQYRPSERDGEEVMAWAVQLIQNEFDNIPFVWILPIKRPSKPESRSITVQGQTADQFGRCGPRIDMIDLAAANDSMVIALCAKQGIPRDNDERIGLLQRNAGKGHDFGMDPMMFYSIRYSGHQRNAGKTSGNPGAIRLMTEMV